jgi:hydroxyethylthiazole kinase-like sugar kinase family protein
MSIIKIAMKPINITGRESEITKLMEKNVMGNGVKSTTEVKINRINLTLSANSRYNRIKKVGDQIGCGRIEFTKTMLSRSKSELEKIR